METRTLGDNKHACFDTGGEYSTLPAKPDSLPSDLPEQAEGIVLEKKNGSFLVTGLLTRDNDPQTHSHYPIYDQKAQTGLTEQPIIPTPLADFLERADMKLPVPVVDYMHILSARPSPSLNGAAHTAGKPHQYILS